MYEEWGSALKEAAEDDSVVLAVVTGNPSLPVAKMVPSVYTYFRIW